MDKQDQNTGASASNELEVVVVGAGISGLGMAYQLLQSGEKNFLVLEREENVGGTWHLSRYPGAGCDIESNLYSFSYAQNKNWSRKFAKRDEIYQYLQDCAKEFGVLPYIRFNHELQSAAWDEASSRWLIQTSKGSFKAKSLVCGTGYLSEPKYPEIPGLQEFKGKLLHTAQWDEGVDLTGKRVAIIGTGASTVQIVPAIQPQVKEVTVFQRSSGWVVPKDDKPNTGFHGWAMRTVPGYQSLLRKIAFNVTESHIWFMQDPKRMGIPQKDAEKHLENSITDENLKARLRPKHVIGCKRWLFSSEYYPALEQDNVEVVTESIASIAEKGVVTENGREIEADVIVLATGYEVTKSQFAQRVINAQGRTLADVWSQGQFAYLGLNVPGFPNYYHLMGPNSAVVHSSATLMSELQVEYTIKALQAMKEQGVDKLDIQPDVVSRYNADVQNGIKKGVWSAGCSSWYIDENGNNTAAWPFSIRNYARRTRRFNMPDYLGQVESAEEEHRVPLLR